jgi:DNA-binding HxlR family transcriptional regulator
VASINPNRCPLQAVSSAIGGKWKIPILGHLAVRGPLRPSQLRRTIGTVSEKVLAEQLRELETDRLVSRHDFQTIPPHVEYALTPLGCELAEHLGRLAEWSQVRLVARD